MRIWFCVFGLLEKKTTAHGEKCSRAEAEIPTIYNTVLLCRWKTIYLIIFFYWMAGVVQLV